MSAAELTHAPAEASAVLPCDRELSTWQERIANAAPNGGGLDAYLAALTWAKQVVPPDNGVREKAKQEIREVAERHLADLHGLNVIDAIYGAAFPDEADEGLATNEQARRGYHHDG